MLAEMVDDLDELDTQLQHLQQKGTIILTLDSEKPRVSYASRKVPHSTDSALNLKSQNGVAKQGYNYHLVINSSSAVQNPKKLHVSSAPMLKNPEIHIHSSHSSSSSSSNTDQKFSKEDFLKKGLEIMDSNSLGVLKIDESRRALIRENSEDDEKPSPAWHELIHDDKWGLVRCFHQSK